MTTILYILLTFTIYLPFVQGEYVPPPQPSIAVPIEEPEPVPPPDPIINYDVKYLAELYQPVWFYDLTDTTSEYYELDRPEFFSGYHRVVTFHNSRGRNVSQKIEWYYTAEAAQLRYAEVKAFYDNDPNWRGGTPVDWGDQTHIYDLPRGPKNYATISQISRYVFIVEDVNTGGRHDDETIVCNLIKEVRLNVDICAR